MRTFLYALDMALEIYIWFLLAVAVLTWLIGFKVVDAQNPTVARIARLLAIVTDPVLWPVRKILPANPKVDISPPITITMMIALRYVLALYVIRAVS